MMSNAFNVEYFAIDKLFGFKNVEIPLSDVQILVDQNGIGKTTVLNALYYVLSCQLERLSTIEFETIRIKFKGSDELRIGKDDVTIRQSARFRLLRKAPPSEWEMWARGDISGKALDVWKHRVYREYLDSPVSDRMSPSRMMAIINEADPHELQKTLALERTILENVPQEIYYLPTYRRIEEDLQKLGIDESIESEQDSLIQFGMKDVNQRFVAITERIRTSSLSGFSQVTGEILHQLIDGINVPSAMKESIKNPDAIKIVLDRVGNNLTDDDKQRINSLAATDQIFSDAKYDPLIYFLSNLVKIYEQQHEMDNTIKQFAGVCNKYLVGKEVRYDESKVSIEIVQKHTGAAVEISKLSSGEKQIVSLFSRIYLGTNKRFVLLFDEPELSLSIDWQQMILPDILDSGMCDAMFVVTHSPFIFANNLDSKAVGLSTFIKEVRSK